MDITLDYYEYIQYKPRYSVKHLQILDRNNKHLSTLLEMTRCDVVGRRGGGRSADTELEELRMDHIVLEE